MSHTNYMATICLFGVAATKKQPLWGRVETTNESELRSRLTYRQKYSRLLYFCIQSSNLNFWGWHKNFHTELSNFEVEISNKKKIRIKNGLFFWGWLIIFFVYQLANPVSIDTSIRRRRIVTKIFRLKERRKAENFIVNFGCFSNLLQFWLKTI